jgi:predicted AAA+ superfamily ATPase
MVNLKYPFDILNDKDTVTRKEAKVLIVKFLKREHCFKEMITECLRYHTHLHSIDEILDNMTDAFSLDECFYSIRIEYFLGKVPQQLIKAM